MEDEFNFEVKGNRILLYFNEKVVTIVAEKDETPKLSYLNYLVCTKDKKLVNQCYCINYSVLYNDVKEKDNLNYKSKFKKTLNKEIGPDIQHINEEYKEMLKNSSHMNVFVLDISVKGDYGEKSISRINAFHREILESILTNKNSLGVDSKTRVSEIQKFVTENNIEFVMLESLLKHGIVTRFLDEKQVSTLKCLSKKHKTNYLCEIGFLCSFFVLNGNFLRCLETGKTLTGTESMVSLGMKGFLPCYDIPSNKLSFSTIFQPGYETLYGENSDFKKIISKSYNIEVENGRHLSEGRHFVLMRISSPKKLILEDNIKLKYENL